MPCDSMILRPAEKWVEYYYNHSLMTLTLQVTIDQQLNNETIFAYWIPMHTM